MKTNRTGRISSGDPRRGAALIMVLGILVILVVLAGAFAVTMRTERQAARNGVEGVRVRMLVPSAIRQAAAEIETDFYTSSKMFASASVASATSTNSAASYYDVSRLYSEGDGGQYIPDTLRAGVQSAIAGTGWKQITDDNNKVVGRFTWVAADCSEFLDANYAIGDPGPGRAEGSIPEEIILYSDINSIGVSDVDDQAALYNSLLSVGRFENYQEFKSFAEGTVGNPDNFFTFSRFPIGALDGGSPGSLITPVSLDGIDTELAGRETELVNAFTSMGLAAADARLAYTNLLDYVDIDQQPRDFTIGTTESVPMFNEFWQSTTVTAVGSNLTCTVSVGSELFYPFVKTTNTFYSINIGTVSAKVTVSDASNNSASQTYSTPFSVTFGSPFGVGEYRTNNILSQAITVNLGGSVAPTNNTVAVEISFTGAEVRSGGTAVDRLIDGVAFSNATASAVSVNDVISGGVECLDPRFNYTVSDANFWPLSTSSSLGSVNAATSAFLSNASNNSDGDTAMYVKDEPLFVVGELGYLPVAPWQTIKLYNNGNNIYDPVHDYFTMTTNTVVYGLVNPNTSRKEVLQAVFHDMAIDQFPGESVPATSRITWAQAGAIADVIMGQQNFNNVSGVIAGASNYVQASSLTGITNELQRESLFRNAGDLLGTRNSVVTLLMLVQAGEDQDNDGLIDDIEVRATEKAAVVIWRDPYPVGTGNTHPFFVRQIHRLY